MVAQNLVNSFLHSETNGPSLPIGRDSGVRMATVKSRDGFMPPPGNGEVKPRFYLLVKSTGQPDRVGCALCEGWQAAGEINSRAGVARWSAVFRDTSAQV